MPENQPYKILGTADDGKAYFLDQSGRLMVTPLESLTQGKLLKLASLTHWKMEADSKSKYGITRDDWLIFQDALIQEALKTDFDPKNIRGRGAWREPDGRICYHNGDPKEIVGDFSENRLYLRKHKIDIGILSDPANKTICKKMNTAILKMSFETPADAIRCMAWSALAPFSGSLPWRSAGLITGPSGSGKTTLLDHVIKKISMEPVQWEHRIFNGGASTVAGIVQDNGNDSGPIIIEEAEGKGKKAHELREEQFSLMRQSTSDDAPKTAKGTADGTGVSYSMKNMFLFISISPEVEDVADDNRLFRINMKKVENDWDEVRDELASSMTIENCRRIRALMWKRLPEILELAIKMTSIVQDISGADTRQSYAESLLLSTYIYIWQCKDPVEVTDEYVKENVTQFYRVFARDSQRDETEEIIERLLDHIIQITESREKVTIRQALLRIKTGKYEYIDENDASVSPIVQASKLKEYRHELALNGVALVNLEHEIMGNNYGVAIVNDSHAIREIIQKGRGYSKYLTRWNHGVKAGHTANIAGSSKKCTLLFKLLEERG